jgi:hypothetical protein
MQAEYVRPSEAAKDGAAQECWIQPETMNVDEVYGGGAFCQGARKVRGIAHCVSEATAEGLADPQDLYR